MRPWHWASIPVLALGLFTLWLVLAYGGLPRLWSHHEHKLIGKRDAIISYTAQDIPGDPINLRLNGSKADIECAFSRAGWSTADPLSLRSGLGIAASVALDRPYLTAPVSPLYFQDRKQDLAFQKAAGRSPDERHHVRLWQIAPNDWMAAATFDRGVGLSLFTLQITHHIGANVDAERGMVGQLLEAGGARQTGSESARLSAGWHRNGGGDRYRTDGQIHVFQLADDTCR